MALCSLALIITSRRQPTLLWGHRWAAWTHSFSLSHSFSPPIIILAALPPSSSHSSSLRPHPLLFLIHFSCTASPSFNRYHYEADPSPLQRNPSFNTALSSSTTEIPRKAQPPEAIKHFQGWLVIKAEALHLYCLGELPWTPHKQASRNINAFDVTSTSNEPWARVIINTHTHAHTHLCNSAKWRLSD